MRRTRRRAGRVPPGVRLRRAGQLVSRTGHRAGQRGGHRRRPLRARQLPRLQGQAAPVEHAHHRVRRPSAGRPERAGLARGHQAATAQLDRPFRGRPRRLPHRRRAHHGLHHPPRHPVRRDLHGPGPRAPAGRQVHPGRLARGHPRRVDRRPRDPGRGRHRLPRAGRLEVRRRAAGRGQGQDRCLHRLVRDQPGQRREDPGLHRRLRPDGLRHRRDHGRPGGRPARLRVRARLRTADHLHRRAHRRPRHGHLHLGGRLRVVRREDHQLHR